MKTLVGVVIGVISVICCGMTYEVTRAFVTENIVDVRIVEVGGHEYVVGTSCSPSRTSSAGTGSNCGTYKNSSQSMSAVNVQSGGSSIAIVHHVGCKACCKTSAH